MRTEKMSELSKPVAWTDERGNLCTNRNKERGLDSRYHQDYEKYTTPFYSQEYVSSLKHESAVNWEAAASLNVENQELKKRIAELEAQLARFGDVRQHYLAGYDDGHSRGLNAGRLYKEDTGMVMHRHASANAYAAEGDE